MVYSTPIDLPDYPEDNAEATDVQPLPCCNYCGAVRTFEDAACNCDLF